MKSTRRDFLKTTAVAVAAPMVVPSTVFGQNAPSNRVNLALIGAGGRGTSDVDYTRRLEAAQFLAVCDCFRDRREGTRDRLNEQYGTKVVTAYRDFRDVLLRDDIDAVMVCTPDHWHVPIAIAAARAKKDMYVEKPLSVSMKWAWALRKAAAENDVVFQYGTQQRSTFQFRQACELVRNGYIGEVERVEAWCDDLWFDMQRRAAEGDEVPNLGSTEPVDAPEGFDYDRWLGPAPVKPYTVDRCTFYGAWHIYDYALGFIAGWGAHSLDIAQWGLDADDTSPVRYEGTGTIPSEGLFDTVAGWDVDCTYASGVKMRFMSADVAQPTVSAYRRWSDHGTTFFGTEGWVSVDRGDIHTSDPKMRGIKLKADDARLRRSAGHPDDFLACVKSRETPLSSLEAAIRSDTISHLSDIAIRLGTAIDWDPKEEKIVGNAEATAMLDRPMRAPWSLETM